MHTALEIEGLISLLEHGHSSVPERVEELLESKVRRLLAELTSPDSETDAPEAATPDNAVASAAEMEQFEDADPFDADDDATDDIHVVGVSDDRESSFDSPSTSDSVPSEVTTVIMEQAVEEDADDLAAGTPTSINEIETVVMPQQPMKLDEKLAIDSSREIRRAFTLNDRFRFRRELFENSEARFVEALDVISAMSSYDEAEEYFYDDLCWDPDNEEVKEFMQKVYNHFR